MQDRDRDINRERPGRNRILYACLVLTTIPLGLGSRSSIPLPNFIATYAGDTLYAVMFFFIFGFLLPKQPTWKIAALAASLSYIIEISQFYHAPWIDNIRQTRIGGLILGYTFIWSDIVCYTVGVAFGSIVDRLIHELAHNTA